MQEFGGLRRRIFVAIGFISSSFYPTSAQGQNATCPASYDWVSGPSTCSSEGVSQVYTDAQFISAKSLSGSNLFGQRLRRARIQSDSTQARRTLHRFA
ncbi:hypothetical protein B0H11DRAFT_1957454 [Mycena galericulata]|nr:hypothetical protein B0H11DRAFT_1957454 [Mycena galericulata]